MYATVTESEIKELSTYILTHSGIVIDVSKGYLIEARLGPLLSLEGFSSYHELLTRAKVDRSGRIGMSIIDAISTNETYFFRDEKFFNLLAHKILPDHFERMGSNGIDIWSAAASTGQELYSIAIVLKELLGDLDTDRISLVGTDISEAALSRASHATYSKLELTRGLSANRLKRFFIKDGVKWRVIDELRGLCSFKKINLLGNLVGVGPFDVIFCRNVAIYFSPENRTKLFDTLATKIRPGGALIIGSTESLVGVANKWQHSEFRGIAYYVRKK